MLNVGYYVPIQLVGLYLWSATPLADTVDTVRVRSLTWNQRALVVTGAVAVIGGYALVLDVLGGTLPLFDSASTVLSVVAMALLVVRATEQWVFWITVNLLSIYMWSAIYLADGVGLAMVVMWTAYLVNSVYGLYNWRRLADAQPTPPPAR
ncbi:nicotinamide riboside transporter PnuC [Natronobiforma cellulositropha]|uniref:nicotinamide riboside transporter PnuC n=1 Tax=Natronobiforma cellulositropha TaxID=1679076 RepID=UPI0021D5FCE8|nr:nicotinamide riboside transporter PnuC [Natronobiforma cellulositropha]